MNELWTFPQGLLAPEDSLKGYDVEARDGRAGTVEWASYAPGESYLVVTVRRHLQPAHHVIPAAAAESVDRETRTVRLHLTRTEVESAPRHHDPSAPLDSSMTDGLAALWPTWLDSRRA